MRFIRNLYAASIWHPDAVPALEGKYASQKKWLWPAVDLVYIGIGVVGAMFGVPSVTAVFGVEAARLLCLAFAFISFVALVGIAFPSMWVWEAYAKVILIGGHAALIGSLFSAAFGLDSLSRLYLVGFITVSMLHIMFRLHILRLERLEREQTPDAEEDA